MIYHLGGFLFPNLTRVNEGKSNDKTSKKEGWTMKRVLVISMVLLLSALSVPAQALEPFVLYDNFNSIFINVEKWVGQESQTTPRVILLENVRAIEWGRIRLLQRSYHTGGSQTIPLDRADNQLRFTAPERITAIKASVKVNAVRTIGCSNSSEPTQARARLLGSFFNTDGPPFNGQQNDVLAYILIERLSDSTDKPWVLKVNAQVLRCTDPNCFTYDNFQTVDLGNINLWRWEDITLVWDKPNMQFIFKLGHNPAVSILYTLPEFSMPGAPVKLIGVSQRYPFCPEPGREAFIDVDFENIFVNEPVIPE